VPGGTVPRAGGKEAVMDRMSETEAELILVMLLVFMRALARYAKLD
jgi:hypothetical protein